MRRRESLASRIWIGPLLGFIIGATTIWPLAYNEVSIGGGPLTVGWVFFCALAGGYVAALSERSLKQIAVLVGGGVSLAVMLRVIVETTLDPTSHNLWPFELVFTMGICFPSALVGAWMGRRLQRT